MPELEVVVAAVSVAAVVVLGVATRIFMRRRARAGRRPDGSWEEGRRLSDMTIGGKLARAVALVALPAAGVLRIVDNWPWFWVSCVVGVLAAFVGNISERRRVRREGIDPSSQS